MHACKQQSMVRGCLQDKKDGRRSNQANEQTSKQADKQKHILFFFSFLVFMLFFVFFLKSGGRFLLLGTTRPAPGKSTRTHTTHGGYAFLVGVRVMCVCVCVVLYGGPNLIAGGGRRIETTRERATHGPPHSLASSSQPHKRRPR